MSDKPSAPPGAAELPHQHENVATDEKTALQSCPSQRSPSRTSLSTSSTHIYPEGGLQAWLVVFGSFCAMFASLGIANTLAAFESYISTNQLISYAPDQIGWIFSLYAFLSFACGIYIGPLFDVYGPRWLIIPGSVCVILSMLLAGLCTEYWHFIIVFSILGGVGTSLLFTPCVAVVGHYFKTHRGLVTGIATSGGAVGGVVFPLTLSYAVPRIGFAWATRIIALIMLVLSLISTPLIRSNLPRATSTKAPRPSLRPLLDLPFLFTTIGSFLLEFALFVPLTYITTYALSTSLPTSISTIILPVLSAGSVFGRILPGLYADYIGSFNLLLICTLLCAVSIFAIWLPFGDTNAGLIVFAAIFGFASGSNISLTPVCVSKLCKIEEYGRYYATCYTIVSIGCLTGVPIAGALVQVCGGKYWGLIVFTGICYVAAFGAFAVARVLVGGWKIWVKF